MWPRVRARARHPLRDASLPAAATIAVLALLALATGVLYLTRRPWLTGWTWDLGTDDMTWKDRLTYAAATATATGAVIALVVNYRKQRDAEEGRFAQQFADAAAQLGSVAPAVRIAGVYAIAALADRNEKHRQQCIDALCGYLRLPYDPEAGARHLASRTIERPSGPVEHPATITTIHSYRPEDREVRLTIIRVIRDHLRDPKAPTTWCGRDLDFTAVVFDGGDFSGARFTGGQVSFGGAQFTGGVISFKSAKFLGGNVAFSGAHFCGASVEFYQAEFKSGVTWFTMARFSGGAVGFMMTQFAGGIVSFEDAEFTGSVVDFLAARFTGGHVTFKGAEFTGGQVDLHLAEILGGRVTWDADVIGCWSPPASPDGS